MSKLRPELRRFSRCGPGNLRATQAVDGSCHFWDVLCLCPSWLVTHTRWDAGSSDSTPDSRQVPLCANQCTFFVVLENIVIYHKMFLAKVKLNSFVYKINI